MKTANIIWAAIAAVAAIPIILYTRATAPKGAQPVSPFEKEKYLGKWYEIARLDFYFEKNLDNVTANYSINNDGTIKVVNRGFDTIKKVWKESIGKAKFTGVPTEAKLEVSFFGPIYAGYNVIALDKDYKHALVAGRNLNYLWILSRDNVLPERIGASFLDQAVSLGYDVSKLLWVKHDR